MLTDNDVSSLLARITVGPSMLFDEGFRFEVMPVGGAGFFLRLRYTRPDTNTGQMDEGDSRWEYVGAEASEDAVIKTGFVLMKLVAEHELLEAFLVDGVRVFDPHQTIEQLQAGKEAVSHA